MGLHVRTVMPYALPGVLALLACWWFFSRKKDGHSKKHLSAFTDKLHADNALEELLKEEPNSSRAQPVQLNKEEESVLEEDAACCLSFEALETSLNEKQPVCKAKDDLKQELQIQNVALGTLQASAGQQVIESEISQSLGANAINKGTEDKEVFISSVHISLDANKCLKDNSNACLTDVGAMCPVSTKSPCICDQASEVQELSTKVTDHLSNDIQGFVSEICFQTEAIKTPEREVLVPQNVDSCAHEIKAVNTVSALSQVVADEVESVSQEVDFNKSSVFSTALCHCEQIIIHENHTSANDRQNNLEQEKIYSQTDDIQTTKTEKKATVKEKGVYPPGGETQVEEDAEVAGLGFNTDVKIHETQSLESVPLEQVTEGHSLDMCAESSMQFKGVISQDAEPLMAGEFPDSCIKSIVDVKDRNCTDVMDAFSKSVVKNEDLDLNFQTVDSLKQVNTKTLLEDYEAKIVEQLAINIISKVIVAAKQEILSSSANDASDNNLVHNEESDSLEKEAQRKPLFPEKEDYGSIAENLTQGLINIDCNCESTQTEKLQTKDPKNGEITSVKSLQQNKEKNIATEKSVYEITSKSDFSPVHRSAEFFDTCQAAMEDSSISACTSEEGISIDDPPQSTVLSPVCVRSFESLTSSGIDLSREMFGSTQATMLVAVVESKTAAYSNGDVKRGSPDLNSEGPMIAELEADHSGGSDVNSMDSVDSGCALGNGEQFQNVKQKSEIKKADLVIWEFEVPKYLVGRLIGKQGRFVSFLKQSSGAKIYISTVPYTQDIQICHLEGSQQQIDRALGLIRKKFKDLNLTNIFAPPPPLIPLPVASWLSLPNNVSVEVVVVNVVNAGHMFVQQRTHPTFHALCGLDHHMSLCYAQPGIPTLPTPAEVGILCAAPVGPNVWWRAQVMAYFEDAEDVEVLYVDYGGYNRVKIQTLRQIRSDFVSLPFQGVEVLLDNVIPLGDEDHFSAEADAVVKELTTGAPMLTQVTNYDETTRLPLVQLWRLNPEEMVSINRTLVERGFAEWIEGY